ncbi:MAG: hypothetical protein A2341_04665 [Deltaproteobacteria bacterium RIFOXYB12_FULL_58_9]|nr:MAG: hypothetical protein A2341_04665 [Deltaproteobacteria bacterium RIFOXYB12_FULL_58_9]
MNIPRQEALLIIGTLFLALVVFALVRLSRSRKHGISLRMQVALTLGFMTTVLTATFAAIIVDRFEARTVVFAHRAALDDARVVSELTARSMEIYGVSLRQGSKMLETSRILYGFTTTLEDTRVQLLDAQGSILFDSLSFSLDKNAVQNRPEVQMALDGKTDDVARPVGDNTVAAAVPILVKNEVAGVARVVKSTFSMKEVLADTAPKVALLALILAGSAVLAGLLIGQALGSPIERLTSAAQRVAKGERQAVLPVPHGREVKALTAAFESMRSELEQRHAVESWAADLSHELKNPVASIRAAAEVLEDAVINDAKAATQFSKRISQSAEKMDALLRDLLSLAKLEAGGVADSKNELELSEVSRGAIDDVEIHAKNRGVQLRLDAREKIYILGDARWIKRAIENLLLNAIAFSAENDVVSIQLAQDGSNAEVVVGDNGPGIDPELLDKVFNRFVTSRKDDAGTGLGLAIVRAVAEAHGGKAEVRATGHGGTTMALTLRRG